MAGEQPPHRVQELPVYSTWLMPVPAWVSWMVTVAAIAGDAPGSSMAARAAAVSAERINGLLCMRTSSPGPLLVCGMPSYT